MRQRSVNYFFGSLFSSQFILAYGMAGSAMTAIQLALITLDYITLTTESGWHEGIPFFLDLYIETLLPIWIGTITAWNIFIVLSNIAIAILLLFSWTLAYDSSY